MFNENRSCIEITQDQEELFYILPFNENRSCIEICSAFLPLFVPLSLMKTEVVLKSGMSQKDFDRLGV